MNAPAHLATETTLGTADQETQIGKLLVDSYDFTRRATIVLERHAQFDDDDLEEKPLLTILETLRMANMTMQAITDPDIPAETAIEMLTAWRDGCETIIETAIEAGL